MSITHSYTRLVAVAAGVTVAFALVLATSAPVRAAALTSTQVSAIVSLLQSFGADAATIANVQASLTGSAPTTPSTGGSMACNASVWTRDLSAGSTGADVMALQKFLNMSAATQVAATGAGSPGMETSTFGPATQAAVIKFQTANGITPAAGYVGPITRSAIASKCAANPTTPGTPGTPGTPSTPTGLNGGEGQIDDIDNLGDVESSVDEGENDVKILGAEFDAKDADISIERVDVEFDNHSGNGSTRLDNYVDSVSLMLDGKMVGTIDANDVERDDNGLYSFRFTNVNGVVREGDTANLYVVVDAISNLDSTDDADTWDVQIPQNGIRAVDGTGLSETYVTAAESTTLTETVTFNTASGGDLQLTEADSNPEAGLVVVDDNNETSDVTLLVVDVEAKNADVTIHDFPIGISSTGGNLSLIAKRVRLMQGSTVLKTKTLTAGQTYQALTFDNVDFDIEEDETVTFKVVADIYDTDSGEPDNGDTITASTTGALAGWDAEDVKGDTLVESTDITGSVAGNTQTFYGSNGVAVTYKSSSAVKAVGSIAGAPDSVDLTIKFSVKNLGDSTIYFDGDVAAGVAAAAGTLTWATTTDSTTGTTTGSYGYGTGIVTADVTDSDDVLDSNDKRFEITAGQTRDFTFKVTINAGGDNVAAGAKLTGFSWDTTSQDATANLYNFDLGSFHTDTVTGLNIQ